MKGNGVYPVLDNEFSIGINGLDSTDEDMKVIKDMETFSPSFDMTVEEWTPMDTEGWMRRLATGNALSIDFSGKRCIGDAGNDYVASLLGKLGKGVETKFKWTFPSGASVSMNCIVNVSNVGGGDSTNVAPLEFTVLSNGKPEFVEAL